MNKVRPGAYINFESVPKPLSSVGGRGVMTMALPLSWGPEGEIIELASTDLLDGKSVSKIGMAAFDEKSMIFQLALSNAYMAYIYRLDKDAKKAAASIGETDGAADFEVTAKYGGTVGNQIQIAVIKNDSKFDVVTFYQGSEKDRQTVAGVSELTENDWVVFSGSKLAESAGAALSGGEDGTVDLKNYTDYFNAIKGYKPWNTMAIAYTGETAGTEGANAAAKQAKEFVKDLRENVGRKVQVVVCDYTDADYEGVISVDQGYKTADGEVTKEMFAVYVAGLTAGAQINQSNTYHVVPGAVEIVEQKDDSEIDDLLKKGHFLLTRRQDGTIVVEQDINTFTSFKADKGAEFSKNRVIRTLDGYANDIRILFENNYIGKVDNNASGRNIFKADVISYLNSLQDMGAIQNFDSDTDIEVKAGAGVEEVILDLWIQPVDAMEKLYNRVYLQSNE